MDVTVKEIIEKEITSLQKKLNGLDRRIDLYEKAIKNAKKEKKTIEKTLNELCNKVNG